MTHKKRSPRGGLHRIIFCTALLALLLGGATACSSGGGTSEINAFDTAVALTSIARSQTTFEIAPTDAPPATNTVAAPPTDVPVTETVSITVKPPTSTPTPPQAATEAAVEAAETDLAESVTATLPPELIDILDTQSARNEVDALMSWYDAVLKGQPFDCEEHNARYDALKLLDIVTGNGSGNRTDRYAGGFADLNEAMTPLYDFCTTALEAQSAEPVPGGLVATAFKAAEILSGTLVDIINEFANQ